MKRITAIAIVVSAVLGCSYVGSVGAADGDYTAQTTCEQVWELSEQPKTTGFIEVSKTNPDITDAVKSSSIKVCDSAKRVGELGGSVEQVLLTVNERTQQLPEDNRRQIAFMAVSGWKIGEMGR